MALQHAAHAAAPATATIHILGQQPVADNLLPDAADAALASNAFASSQSLSAGLPSAYASHMQSFPMVPPALRVMIPTNTASQSYHNSPHAPQVCSLFAQTSFGSLPVTACIIDTASAGGRAGTALGARSCFPASSSAEPCSSCS